MVLFLFSKALYPVAGWIWQQKLTDVKQMWGVYMLQESFQPSKKLFWQKALHQVPQEILRWPVYLYNSPTEKKE